MVDEGNAKNARSCGERRHRMKKRIWMMAMVLAAGFAMSASAEETTGATTEMAAEAVTGDAVRVGSLKGPTSMGLVSLMQKAKNGETKEAYDFTMVTAADELLGKVISGDLDIALVPANVASVLYNKTEGGVQAIDINTLGVLYVVENGDQVQSMKGKTLYLTGKGTTPDYVIQYLLKANGLTTDDVTLEYKSEATEVVAALAEDTAAIGLLPQPFVTAAMTQNENLRVALDLTAEWDATQEEGGSRLVTGVTIARTDFLEENEDAVKDFLAEHEESAAFTNENPEQAAQWIAELEIVAKAPIAQKAIPACNITCIDGKEMKDALGGYLSALYELEPTAIGGALPADDFYYGVE